MLYETVSGWVLSATRVATPGLPGRKEQSGRYLATCIRYVVLNPVRAGMVTQAKSYAYSSANEPKPNEINAFAGCVPGGGVCVARMEVCGESRGRVCSGREAAVVAAGARGVI